MPPIPGPRPPEKASREETECPLILISAMTHDRVIGRAGALPWSIPDEYEHFLSEVRGNTVLMGRTSFEIFGRDLTESRLVVVSGTLHSLPGAEVRPDVASALERARAYGRPVFSGGGATIYRATLPLADAMHLSLIKEAYEGDTYFPAWDEAHWDLVQSKDRGRWEFRIYRRR